MRQRPARLLLAGCVAATLSLGTALAGVPASAGPDDRPATSSAVQEQAKKPRSLVQFLSKDGTAETGTTTTFTLTSVATGAALRIPVIGQGPNTTYSQVVKPGKYTVTSEPSVLNGATYTVSALTPASGAITVKKPKKGTKKNAVTKVTFSLAKDAPDTLMTLGGATPTAVSLSWTGPEGASYSLRRTEGYTPAATAEDGTAVALTSPTATATEDTTVAEATTYTYTLFGSVGSQAVEPSSISLATPSAAGDQPTFALAPDTVLPATLEELDAEPLTETTVAVTLSQATERASRTAATAAPAGRWTARRADEPCVVGAPFLLSTEAAGTDAFYGVIESCDGGSAARRRAGESRAVVDTDVPLSAVLSYLDIEYDASACLTDTEGATETTCAPSADPDGDGLTNVNERDAGTNPGDPDTDDDGLTDGQEVQDHASDPLRQDTDRDDFTDEEEVEEDTEPSILDTDEDGLLDAEEVFYSETDPRSADTDGDGFSDTREVEEDSNPDNAKSVPTKPRKDSDGDGLTDPREELNESDPTVADTDGDGLSDFVEVTVWASYPDLEDSDDDGVDDGDEVAAGRQPMEDESTVIPPFSRAAPRAIAARGVSCSGSGTTVMDPRAGFDEEKRFKVRLSGTKFSYDVAYVAKLFANPYFRATGGVVCQLSVESGSIQLAVTPVPVTLNFWVDGTASSSGFLKWEGPALNAQVGFRGKGSVEVATRCDYIFFCYPELRQSHNFTPVQLFDVGRPSLEISGKASLFVAASLNVSVGFDNRFGKAKAGFTGTVKPFDTTLNVAAGFKNRCAKFDQYGAADLTMKAEAWAISPKYGFNYQRQLFSSEFGRSSGYWGNC